MRKFINAALAVSLILFAIGSTAIADGVHKLFKRDGRFIGVVYVEGDVKGGRVYLELANRKMKFYVDPKAIKEHFQASWIRDRLTRLQGASS